MFIKLAKYFLFWRVLLILAIIPAMFFVPLRDGYTNLSKTTGLIYNLYNTWSNFDGAHYLQLARVGYDKPTTHLIYAFLPVYPWLIRQFSFLGTLGSALTISHISFFLSLLLLYKLLRLDWSKKVSTTSIALLLLFPTSFFFGSVYNESVFLLLTVSCFYLARKSHFFPASILAMIASATRVTGILLWGVIFIELLNLHKNKLRSLFGDTRVIWLALPPLGLISYMKFQFIKTGNAFFFITSQPGFGANRIANKLILLHQVFFRYFKMLIFVNHTSPLFFTVTLEFITAIVFLFFVFYTLKKTRPSYAFYSILSYLIPTFTGTFSSLPRYVLVIFPAFALLSSWFVKQNKIIKLTYIIVNLILGLVSISLFARGYFVG